MRLLLHPANNVAPTRVVVARLSYINEGLDTLLSSNWLAFTRGAVPTHSYLRTVYDIRFSSSSEARLISGFSATLHYSQLNSEISLGEKLAPAPTLRSYFRNSVNGMSDIVMWGSTTTYTDKTSALPATLEGWLYFVNGLSTAQSIMGMLSSFRLEVDASSNIGCSHAASPGTTFRSFSALFPSTFQ